MRMIFFGRYFDQSPGPADYGHSAGLLITLSLHLFTRTKLEWRKYLTLGFIFIISTYLIRFLPITLGVNTVLSLLVEVISFQFFYKFDLSKMIRLIASAVISIIMIAVSEILSMMLLVMIVGANRAEELFTSTGGIMQGLSTLPSNIFFAIFIFIGYQILKFIDKRKKANGEAGRKDS